MCTIYHRRYSATYRECENSHGVQCGGDTMYKTYTTAEVEQLIARHDLATFYNSVGWRRLSREVIKSYHGECSRCRQRGRYARASVVHHVRPLKEYPALAYSRYYTECNGSQCVQLMPLCRACHEEIHHRTPHHTPPLTPERWD